MRGITILPIAVALGRRESSEAAPRPAPGPGQRLDALALQPRTRIGADAVAARAAACGEIVVTGSACHAADRTVAK